VASTVISGEKGSSQLAATPRVALECPVPQPANVPDATQETPAHVNELAEVLAAGDLSNRMPAFAPCVGRPPSERAAGEIVNQLITAYCPPVDRVAISDPKKTRLNAFVDRAVRAAF
jgi:hypothetical protein